MSIYFNFQVWYKLQRQLIFLIATKEMLYFCPSQFKWIFWALHWVIEVKVFIHLQSCQSFFRSKMTFWNLLPKKCWWYLMSILLNCEPGYWTNLKKKMQYKLKIKAFRLVDVLSPQSCDIWSMFDFHKRLEIKFCWSSTSKTS